MFGYSTQEAEGKNVHELITPEREREKAHEGLKNFFLTGTGPIVGKTRELSALRKDGAEFPIELSVSAMNIRRKWHSAAIIRDITKRKEAEEKINKQLDELIRFEKATIQREFRLKELKDETARLKAIIAEMEKKRG